MAAAACRRDVLMMGWQRCVAALVTDDFKDQSASVLDFWVLTLDSTDDLVQFLSDP